MIAKDGALSELASHAVAGLLHHHEAMAGLLAPTVNSYDRLSPASLAGYWANWAEDHRLVTVRTSTASANQPVLNIAWQIVLRILTLLLRLSCRRLCKE